MGQCPLSNHRERARELTLLSAVRKQNLSQHNLYWWSKYGTTYFSIGSYRDTDKTRRALHETLQFPGEVLVVILQISQLLLLVSLLLHQILLQEKHYKRGLKPNTTKLIFNCYQHL